MKVPNSHLASSAAPLLGLAWIIFCSSGCYLHGGAKLPDAEMFAQGINRASHLTERYGEIHVPVCSEQFKLITSRLGISEQSGYTIRILATHQPAAFSPGAKTIFISKGLIRLLTSESQAAFVIAHELSHYQLLHVEEASSRVPSGDNAAIERRKELEIAADQRALSMLARGGYETTEAVIALQAVYRHVKDSAERALYPSLAERITSIAQQITTAHTHLGPGTITRRDFARCRHSLYSD